MTPRQSHSGQKEFNYILHILAAKVVTDHLVGGKWIGTSSSHTLTEEKKSEFEIWISLVDLISQHICFEQNKSSPLRHQLYFLLPDKQVLSYSSQDVHIQALSSPFFSKHFLHLPLSISIQCFRISVVQFVSVVSVRLLESFVYFDSALFLFPYVAGRVYRIDEQVVELLLRVSNRLVFIRSYHRPPQLCIPIFAVYNLYV